ncbi:MAG TPA: cation:proton antiporter, partial [Pirellulales bacterium]|nr:cation:proton antiporter [Pirellulales bacterium]
IVTLTGGLSAALALGYLTHRLGLSPIVGYLLAGIVVGPASPGFVADEHLAGQMAEVGVILLMFGVGLHFRVEDLLAVRKVALPGALLQIAAAAAVGAAVTRLAGWTWSAAIVFGLSMSVASTVVLTRVLGERNALHTPLGHLAIGWLVVQDLFAVFALILLPPLFAGGTTDVAHLAVFAGVAAVKIAALAVVVLVVGGRVIPWVLRRVAQQHSRELFTLTVLVVALGNAVGAARLFGVSMALGAFLAGMVVGRSDFSLRAATDALPMRDAFAVLFFVSIGMLFDPAFMLKSPGLVAATLAAVMIGTPLITFGVVSVLGLSTHSALRMGLALGQIGEFSFILARLGTALGILPDDALHNIVAVSILSISLNPLVFRLADSLSSWLRRGRAAAQLASAIEYESNRPEDDDGRHRAVVVGYGPVGRTLVRLLRENGIVTTIIEMNLKTVERLKAEGATVVYGDANHPETLCKAGVAQARALLLSASGLTEAKEIVRMARSLNPNIRILARSAYLRERAELRQVGANEVYAEEGEVALAMTESVLRKLGATPDQIDRERDRVRADLFGEPAAKGNHATIRGESPPSAPDAETSDSPSRQ